MLRVINQKQTTANKNKQAKKLTLSPYPTVYMSPWLASEERSDQLAGRFSLLCMTIVSASPPAQRDTRL